MPSLRSSISLSLWWMRTRRISRPSAARKTSTRCPGVQESTAAVNQAGISFLFWSMRKRSDYSRSHYLTNKTIPMSRCNSQLWRTTLQLAIISVLVVNCISSGQIYMPTQSSLSSPVYANAFEIWGNPGQIRHSTSPVTFRVQCETRYGWEVILWDFSCLAFPHTVSQVCVAGGCESLGYWDPRRALLLRTDPSRYPIWEVSDLQMFRSAPFRRSP